MYVCLASNEQEEEDLEKQSRLLINFSSLHSHTHIQELDWIDG